MKERIVAYCYEGLANRLDTLITSSFLAKRYNVPLFFFWMDDCICNDAKVSDLFEKINAIEYKEDTFLNFVETQCEDMFAMSRDISNIGERVNLNSCESFNCNVSLSDLDAVDKKIIFVQTCTIPHWASNKNAIESFYKFFLPHKSFYKKPLSHIGIHIRGTDMLVGRHIKEASVEDAIEFAKEISNKHKGEKIFICSDDENIETALKNIPNSPFIMFEKDYVMKRNNEFDYYDGYDENGFGINYKDVKTFEYNGKKYKNIAQTNLFRSKTQVQGGFTDLLALSQLQYLYGYKTSSFSTFFILANLLKYCNVLPKHNLLKHIL